MEKERILFNQKCSLCNFEINHYKTRSDLNFVDCSDMEDKYLKQLHVIFPDNTELSGVDAFIYTWNHTKGYEVLGKIIALPVIKSIAVIVYAVIARLLYWKFKLFHH
jgi:predicted DCC family thiol-disulfide oxidoreductase YuxK|tara:strand:+ start:3580 stop:3900 length:321 start_codon:yes stop_codon:yes gene_type:complete